MGINLEYVTIMGKLRASGALVANGSVLEFGAQDISADPHDAARHARRCGLIPEDDVFDTAATLYKNFGFTKYVCIDASGEHGALVYDLNTIIKDTYSFAEQFDLVTNLGTFEHCFNIASVFINMHNACKKNGFMIHQFPSNCNANHGYYALQPRLIMNIAAANNYKVDYFFFTVDYKPILYTFSKQEYQLYDDRDLMCYVVLQKQEDKDFLEPFDDMFSEKNKISTYAPTLAKAVFGPYIKGSWSNIRPSDASGVPTDGVCAPRCRRYIKRIINFLGGKFC